MATRKTTRKTTPERVSITQEDIDRAAETWRRDAPGPLRPLLDAVADDEPSD